MADQTALQSIKDNLSKANDIYVLVAQNPTFDMMASATALYLSLKESGKNVFIACPDEVRAEFSRIVGIDQVTDNIGNRNLVVSFKVAEEGQIDKVSYNLDADGKTFNLIIKPKSGASPLKSDEVTYTYAGAEAQLIFLVGVNRLEDLGHFYQNERKLFTDSVSVSLTRFPSTGTATYNYSDTGLSSLSELTYRLMEDLELSAEVTGDTASNLLAGIDQATNQLQNPMLKANTFEAVANLMKAGGTRQVANTSAQAFPGRQSFIPKEGWPQAPIPVRPTPTPTEVVSGETIVDTSSTDVPEEWLTPKIYKGGKGNPNTKG